jgi:hypothetical protein
MIISFLLSFMNNRAAKAEYTWAPALDLSDSEIYSALIPGAHN